MGALAAFAVLVSFAAPAFAAEPGESGTWNEEYVGSQPLEARGTVSEAGNGQGDLLQVWRGETNNIVWLSLDNGHPFQFYNPDGTSTVTNVSSTVVPIGSNNFMVLHTGTDGNIYYAMVYPDGTSTPGWSGSWSNQLRGQAVVSGRRGVQGCPARASRMACMGGTALSLMVIR
jgi:hypothetical protein